METEGLDPITRDVIRNYLYSAADTMAVTVVTDGPLGGR